MGWLYGILERSRLKLNDGLPPSWILASKPPVMLATWSFRRACSAGSRESVKPYATRHMRSGKKRKGKRVKGATAYAATNWIG